MVESNPKNAGDLFTTVPDEVVAEIRRSVTEGVERVVLPIIRRQEEWGRTHRIRPDVKFHAAPVAKPLS